MLLNSDEEQRPLTREELRLLAAWNYILNDRKGRVAVCDILRMCLFGNSAFGGTSDATLFNSGRQAVGESIMAMVNTVFPESYALMMKEAKEDVENDRASDTGSKSGTDTE